MAYRIDPEAASVKKENSMSVERMNHLIQVLRGEGGCPWDRKQTPQSLSTYLLEEAYELAEAIASGDAEDVRNELGDVLFQILFIAELYREQGSFELEQVISDNIQKMEGRHPHVFGDIAVDSVEEVKKNWIKIKEAEKKKKEEVSTLESVPASMPALMRAHRISARAAAEGFDWDDLKGVMAKAEEEWAELQEAMEKKDQKNMALEFGDLLFTLVNIARFSGMHPEEALKASTQKFEKRYRYMKQMILDQGRTLDTMSQEDKDLFWEMAKRDT